VLHGRAEKILHMNLVSVLRYVEDRSPRPNRPDPREEVSVVVVAGKPGTVGATDRMSRVTDSMAEDAR